MNDSPLVIDIETVGQDWASLDPEVQEYLIGKAGPDADAATAASRLGLHPATGRIIAIGLWRPDEDRGGVLVESDHEQSWQRFDGFDGDAMIFRSSEEGILREFWRYIQDGAGTIITFNGRSFDGPFLMLRSAQLGIPPSRNLVPYRFSMKEHCDLAEVVTFYRARPLDSLDFWCRQFGIPSPKTGMDGSDVAAAYAAGDIEAIGRYCLQDVRATAALYNKLLPIIRVLDRR